MHWLPVVAPGARVGLMKLTFKQWCELNGRRWTGCANFEEFKKNAEDYEKYLAE